MGLAKISKKCKSNQLIFNLKTKRISKLLKQYFVNFVFVLFSSYLRENIQRNLFFVLHPAPVLNWIKFRQRRLQSDYREKVWITALMVMANSLEKNTRQEKLWEKFTTTNSKQRHTYERAWGKEEEKDGQEEATKDNKKPKDITTFITQHYKTKCNLIMLPNGPGW